MDSYVTPAGWTNGPLSPTDKELQWLFAWLRANIEGYVRVLEFGGGATSLCIHQAIFPSFHLMIEDYKPVVNQLKKHMPSMPRALIVPSATYVTAEKWDIVLVDSSVGMMAPEHRGYKRDEAVKAAIPHMAKTGYIILHDWHAAGGRKPRKLLESLGWELVDCCYDRTGFGVYQCRK